MRILVTNDDGIHAAGLDACKEIAAKLGAEVWVVAPETDQSGVSHSLSLNDPLRLREAGERHFAVKGTPTDCVIMGVRHIMKEPPDLILSGVNWGSNLGDDVTYSGTIAGAMEGCALGIPSIALSQAYDEEDRRTIDWSAGEAHGPDLVRRLVNAGWPQGLLLNVNFPGCAADEVQGVVAVPQGTYDLQSTEIIQRTDVRQRAYYWIGLRRRKGAPAENSDLGAVHARKISVTPLHLNLTEMAVLEKIQSVLDDSRRSQ